MSSPIGRLPISPRDREVSAKIGGEAPIGVAVHSPAANDTVDLDSGRPLVVELDGVLIRTEVAHETLLDGVRSNPHLVWKLPFLLWSGRAATVVYPTGGLDTDVERWPVDEQVIDFVRSEARGGRKVVLLSSADASMLEAVAARFAFISETITVDHAGRIDGFPWTEVLSDRFPGGFDYVGKKGSDVAIWRLEGEVARGDGGAVTGAKLGSFEASGSEFVAVLSRRPAQFKTLRRALRLHQWAKNSLIFVPLLLGGLAGDPQSWLIALVGFLALGLVASATYIVNDLWDLTSDRRHWSKCARPIASGELAISSAVVLALGGLTLGLGIAVALGPRAIGLIGVYLVMTLAYSFYMKRIPVLDVLVLAGLFTLRIGIGMALVDAKLSHWLLVFSMFVFVSLSTAKRHSEILRLAENGKTSAEGRGYLLMDAPLTLALGLASMLGAVLIMTLYLIEDALPFGFYRNPAFLWFFPPILFLFLGRIWLLCQRGQLNDDPVEFAIKDRVSLSLGCGMAVSFFAAVVLPSLL